MTGFVKKYQQLLRFCLCTIFCSLLVTGTYAQTAAFTIDNPSGCAPLSVNFTDASSGGTIVSRTWDLGSGPITNTDPTVGANFNTPGTYTIQLTVSFSNGTTQTQQQTVTVHPKPVANFTADNLIGCATLPVQFTDASTTATGIITSWNWSFGAGSASTQNPSYSFSTNGQYTVSLFVENNWGCRSDAETRPNYITVHNRPTAAFALNTDASCTLPYTPVFNNTTTGNGTLTYQWNFGNGETSADEEPVYAYTTPGVYTITLTATNGANCNSNTASRTVYVGKPATTPVLTGPANLCVNTSGYFSFPGVSPSNWIQSVSWDFDNGTVLNGSNGIYYTYPSPGTYNVTATIRYRSGCEDIISTPVTVSPRPDITVTALPSAACQLPLTTTFTANATPVNPNYSYNWDFGDGTSQSGTGLTTIWHSYTGAGTYTVTVTVTDPDNPNTACNSRTTTAIVRAAIPAIDIYSYAPQTGCKPLLTIFNSYLNNLVTPATGIQYTWNFGDGSLEYVVTANSLSSNASHLYTTAGSFTVRVTARTPEGCTTYDEVVVSVTDECPPGNGGGGGGGGGFGNNGGSCANRLAYDFTANTVPGTTVYSWNFGDPASGAANEITGNNPTITHIFSGPNTYTITLTREVTATGVLVSTTRVITVTNDPIVPAFTANPIAICPNGIVTFTPTGINADRVRRYTWNFGDGSPTVTITNTTPPLPALDGVTTHAYTRTGTFTATLTIEDRLGCITVSDNSVEIIVDGPTADFTADVLSSCNQNFDVTFTPTQTPIDPSVPIVQWIWNFGDGNIVNRTTADPVTHTYSNSLPYNAYDVRLTVEDANGCQSDVVLKPAYIKAYRPQASFYANNILRCNNYTVTFYNTSNAQGIPATPNYKFTWNFGDGSTEVVTNSSAAQTHTYPGDGEYTVTLTVMDENGCSHTYTQNNYIRIVKPVADFEPGGSITQCAPISLGFVNLSETYGQAATYTWDFGNGGTGSTAVTPQPVIYPVPNDYMVTLTVRSLGCESIISKPIMVKGPRGNLAANVLPGCKPYTLNMQVTGTNISSYAWDFNDGTPVTPSATNHTVAHVYNLAGIYNPNVILRSPEGCSFTLRPANSIIVDSVKAKFTADNTAFCDAGIVNFTNSSAVPSFSRFTSQIWNFGDGNSFTGANPPAHQYNSPGTYTVSLQTESQYGCTDMAQTVIRVNTSPGVQITGPDNNCLIPGSILQYEAVVNTTDIVTQYAWQLNGAPVGTNSASLNIDYRQPGIHQLLLTVTTDKDCSTTVSRSIVIDSVVAGFNIDENIFCGNGTVTLTNQSTVPGFSGFTTQTWNLGDGSPLFSGSTPPPHTYTIPNTYTINLAVASQYGCTDNLSKTVTVHPMPAAQIDGAAVNCLQPGTSLQYNAIVNSADPITTYQWQINGIPMGQNDPAFAVDYRQPGTHTLSLTVTTNNNCSVTVTRNIITDSVVTRFTIDNNFHCATGQVLFTNNSTSAFPFNSYTWNYDNGITSSLPLTGGSYTYPSPGEYYPSLQLQTVNGCSNQYILPQMIKVYTAPIVSITGEEEKCAQHELSFSSAIQSEDAVTSTVWHLNNTIISNTTEASYRFTQAGDYVLTFTVTTQHNCVVTVMKNIKIHPLPVPNATPQTATICEQTTLQLQAGDGIQYAWTPAQGIISGANSANPVVSPDNTTKYYVTVTNQFNCVQKDSVLITVDRRVRLTHSDNQVICIGQSVQLQASGNTSQFVWSPATGLNNATIRNPLATPAQTTTYSVTGISQNVCPNETGHVLVVVGSYPTVDLGADVVISAGQQHTFNPTVSNDVEKYLWQPATGLSCTNCARPDFFADDDITYRLTVTNQYNCSTSDEVRVTILCNKGAIYVPNAFTPNGDGKNDIFYIGQSFGVQEIKSFNIFNRWGQLVFSRKNIRANDRSSGWDGRIKGQPVETTTVFVYTIEAICNENLPVVIKGTVTLIK
jgi:gliding motility-associated-like protein